MVQMCKDSTECEMVGRCADVQAYLDPFVIVQDEFLDGVRRVVQVALLPLSASHHQEVWTECITDPEKLPSNLRDIFFKDCLKTTLYALYSITPVCKILNFRYLPFFNVYMT